MNILHIEDDALDRELTRIRLLKADDSINLHQAEDGRQAIDTFKELSINCIISDFQMPGMNGMEVLQTIRRQLKSTTPFIFLTGQGNEQIAAEALRSGADDYFTKEDGFAIYERLLNSIRTHVTARQSRQKEKEAASRITHLNNVLAALRRIHRLTATARSRNSLIDESCNCLVEQRGYDHAWIALVDANGDIEESAAASRTGGTERLVRHIREGGFAPIVESVLESGGLHVFDGHDDFNCPVQMEQDNPAEWATMSACLSNGTCCYGIITVVLTNQRAQDEEEQALFSEIADDISFGLNRFELERRWYLAEEKFEYSRANLQSIITANPCAICVIQDERIVWSNPMMGTMLGYTTTELAGLRFSTLFPGPEECEAAIESFNINRNRDYSRQHTQWVQKDGNHIDIVLQQSPILLADRTHGSSIAAIDITDQVRLQKEFHDSSIFFQDLFEQVPVPYQSMDKQGRLRAVNSAWLKLLGYTKASDVIGRKFSEFLSEEQQASLKENFARFKREGKVSNIHYTMRTRDGSNLNVLFEGIAHYDASGHFAHTHCVFEVS